MALHYNGLWLSNFYLHSINIIVNEEDCSASVAFKKCTQLWSVQNNFILRQHFYYFFIFFFNKTNEVVNKTKLKQYKNVFHIQKWWKKIMPCSIPKLYCKLFEWSFNNG